MQSGLYRCNLEDAIFDAGFGTIRAFARAIGYADGTVRAWLRCAGNPSKPAREAIARVLELSPGADCAGVAEADIDWLLEPCDEFG